MNSFQSTISKFRLLPYTLPLWAMGLYGEDAPVDTAGEGPYIPPEPAALKDYDFTTELIKMLSTLGLMLLALVAIAWFLKRVTAVRMEQVNTTSSIKVLERRVLGPKAAVYLLEVRGKGMLVSESPNGLGFMTEVSLSESNQEMSEFETTMQQGSRS